MRVCAFIDSIAFLLSASHLDEVVAAISKAVETFGSIQGCINCAGIATAYKLVNPKGTSMPTSIFETTIKINLIGTFIVSKVCAQQMALQELKDEKERGVIILTGSIAAYEGQQGQIGYSASKGGVISMTLPMSRELAPYGIRVMSIAPGVFETPMSSLMSKKVRTALEQDCVFPKRLGNPIEFALLVASIIENPMLNGSTIRLDGASRLSKL